MAENKEQELQKNSFIGFMTSGADQNVELINTLGDLEGMIASAKYDIATTSGAMSEEEAAAMYAEETAAIDEQTKQNLSDNTKLMWTNGLINGVGLALSAVQIGSEVSAVSNMAKAVTAEGVGNLGKVVTNETKNAAGEVIKTTTHKVGLTEALKNVGFKNIFGTAAKAGEGASVLGKVGAGVVNAVKAPGAAVMTASKFFLTHGKVLSKAVGVALPIAAAGAPFALAKIYTTGRTEDAADGYQQSINTCLAMHESLIANGDQLKGDMAEDFGKWDEAYTTESAAIYEKLDAGEITKDQADIMLEDLSKDYSEKLKPLQEKYAEEGRNIIGPALAGVAGDTIIDKSYDLEDVEDNSYEVRHSFEENPDVRENVVTYQKQQAELDTGSTFTNFLSSINASILHYLPGASYVEAAIIKGADVLMDFVANKVPVLSSVINYEEKHKGESLSELAKTISDNAEVRYEAEHSMRTTEASIESAYEDWDDVDLTKDEPEGPELAGAPA